MYWFEWLMFPLALIVIVSVVLQNSADTAMGAFTGEKSDLFKNKKIRGPELFLNYLTIISASLLILIIIISSAMMDRWEPNINLVQFFL